MFETITYIFNGGIEEMEIINDDLKDEILEWHKKTFPNSTIDQQWRKLCEEIAEMAKEEDTERLSEEIADFIIALTALQYRYGFKLDKYVSDKMQINKARIWGNDGKHIKEADWLGKVCWFWDDFKEDRVIGLLKSINTNKFFKFECESFSGKIPTFYKKCTPALHSEFSFVDKKDV